MSDTTPSTTPPTPVWDADMVYHVLADASRRRLLLSLAAHPLQTATALHVAIGRKLDATLKHLVALRAAGLVETEENPQDGRRLLYRLGTKVVVRQTETGREIDFGFVLVRLG